MILFTETAIKTMISNFKMAELRHSRGINKYTYIVMVHTMQFQKILLSKENSTSIFTILKLGT